MVTKTAADCDHGSGHVVTNTAVDCDHGSGHVVHRCHSRPTGLYPAGRVWSARGVCVQLGQRIDCDSVFPVTVRCVKKGINSTQLVVRTKQTVFGKTAESR